MSNSIFGLKAEGFLAALALKLIQSYKLGGAFDCCYDASIPKLAADLSPSLMPWEYRNWDKYRGPEERRAAIRHSFEGIPEKDIPKYATKRFFRQKKLEGLLSNHYGGSVHLAIEDAYPGQFKPWEFNKVQNGYWRGEDGLEHAAEAVRWLLDRRGVTLAELDYKMVQSELVTMFEVCFGNSIRRLRKYVAGTQSCEENQVEKAE